SIKERLVSPNGDSSSTPPSFATKYTRPHENDSSQRRRSPPWPLSWGAMRILFVSAEVAPFSKTGGLGDVAGALPQALARLGHEVVVVTPWYANLRGGRQPYWIGDIEVPFAGGFERVGVGTLEDGDLRLLFVGHEYFRRPQLYGYADDVERFALFSRAVPQVSERAGFVPDVLHANDWHSGYLPMLLAHGWHLPEGFPGLASLFTVHNVQYQ